jgi:Ca2+-binding RTX toxin-like protein
MLLDIAAIQHLYGANMATRSGDTTYSWARGERIFETLWDGGGIDTLDWSNQSSAARIDLNAGAWSQLGPARGSPQSRDTLAISYGVVIEKAKGGAGNDTLIGNSAGNTLDGGRGNDFLSGGAGDDWFLISAGRDTIEGGAGFDTVDFTSQSRNGLAVNLAGYREVEAFVGGNGGERVTGTAAAERLESRGGNDTLAGGGGNDTLSGGAGRDSFDFLAAPGSANADRILDFASRSDKIRLDDAVHARLGSSGNFSSNDARFWAATGASRGHDASDRVIYDTSSGNLYYDADGSGGGAAFLVATLQGTPGLTASDIAVV